MASRYRGQHCSWTLNSTNSMQISNIRAITIQSIQDLSMATSFKKSEMVEEKFYNESLFQKTFLR